MSELGLFPLGIVLLPTERVPLHIFEPRYKELIGECLDSQGEFGLVLADDEGLRAVGTRAAVTDVLHRFPDGRLQIVVEGGERFRLVRMTSGRSFQTAEVEPLEDEDADAADDERERALELYGRLTAAAGSEPDELDADSSSLSFEIAARIDFGAELKQRLLETRSEPERLETLAGLLEQAEQAVAAERERAEHASTNGKVSPLYER
ncbi:MAG TPA: LON peptidase substrate-binding domain-containing protein [Gaiellaceae bacterium]